MFGLIKLNLLISTTNNPPRRKDLGESPRIHQAFHRKFTATTRENQDQDPVSAPLHCQVIHDLDELGYPIWRNPMKSPYLKFKI